MFVQISNSDWILPMFSYQSKCSNCKTDASLKNYFGCSKKNIWFCSIKIVCIWILFSVYVSVSILKTSLCVITGLKKIEKIKLVLIFAKKNLGSALFYWFWSYRVLWLLTNKDSIFQFHSYVVNLYY